MSNDSFTEVSSESWFSRIGGAIKGVFFGILLFLLAFPLLFWNEGRAVQTAKSLAEGAKAVVGISADKVDKANEGKLVHLTARAETEQVLDDPAFGISANAIRLTRDVQMYQWVEETKSKKKKKLGGGTETVKTYTYKKQWANSLNSSGGFAKPEGHQNPAQMPFDEFSVEATDVAVGAFRLSPGLIGKISKPEPLPVSAENLPADLASDLGGRLLSVGTDGADGFYLSVSPVTPKVVTPKVVAPIAVAPIADPAPETTPATDKNTDTDALATSDEPEKPAESRSISKIPANPNVGDARITFTVTKPTEVSVMAGQKNDTFEPYQTEAGNAINMLSMGDHSARAMFKAAESANAMLTWILRLVGLLLMLFGLSLILRPLSVLADVVPLIGDVIGVGTTLVAGLVAFGLTLLTISIAWLFYRPLIGIPLFVLGVVAIVLVVRAIKKKRTPAIQTTA
jgi:hypothetical protein